MIQRRKFLGTAAAAAALTATGRRASAAANAFVTAYSATDQANPQSLSLPFAGTLVAATATLTLGQTVPPGGTVSATINVGADSLVVTIPAGKRTGKAIANIAVGVGEVVTWSPTNWTGFGIAPAISLVLAIS